MFSSFLDLQTFDVSSELREFTRMSGAGAGVIRECARGGQPAPTPSAPPPPRGKQNMDKKTRDARERNGPTQPPPRRPHPWAPHGRGAPGYPGVPRGTPGYPGVPRGTPGDHAGASGARIRDLRGESSRTGGGVPSLGPQTHFSREGVEALPPAPEPPAPSPVPTPPRLSTRESVPP
jgi:hypothetical protein